MQSFLENTKFSVFWVSLRWVNDRENEAGCFSSVQFSHSVVSDSLWPREWQHARPSCPSPTAGVHSNSCPSSQWCHPAISSSVVPFSSCPQSLPASECFPISQLFTSGGQSIGVSALASVLPINTQDWSPLGWTGWISLQSKGLSRVFSNIKTMQIFLLTFLLHPLSQNIFLIRTFLYKLSGSHFKQNKLKKSIFVSL